MASLSDSAPEKDPSLSTLDTQQRRKSKNRGCCGINDDDEQDGSTPYRQTHYVFKRVCWLSVPLCGLLAFSIGAQAWGFKDLGVDFSEGALDWSLCMTCGLEEVGKKIAGVATSVAGEVKDVATSVANQVADGAVSVANEAGDQVKKVTNVGKVIGFKRDGTANLDFLPEMTPTAASVVPSQTQEWASGPTAPPAEPRALKHDFGVLKRDGDAYEYTYKISLNDASGIEWPSGIIWALQKLQQVMAMLVQFIKCSCGILTLSLFLRLPCVIGLLPKCGGLRTNKGLAWLYTDLSFRLQVYMHIVGFILVFIPAVLATTIMKELKKVGKSYDVPFLRIDFKVNNNEKPIVPYKVAACAAGAVLVLDFINSCMKRRSDKWRDWFKGKKCLHCGQYPFDLRTSKGSSMDAESLKRPLKHSVFQRNRANQDQASMRSLNGSTTLVDSPPSAY